MTLTDDVTAETINWYMRGVHYKGTLGLKWLRLFAPENLCEGDRYE
jgi:hypothetical protein